MEKNICFARTVFVIVALYFSSTAFSLQGAEVIERDDKIPGSKSVFYLSHGDDAAEVGLPCSSFLVIDARILMTTAHCVTRARVKGEPVDADDRYKDKPYRLEKSIQVFQTTNFNAALRRANSNTAQIRHIRITPDQIFVHPDFRKVNDKYKDGQDADLAVIVLSSPIVSGQPLPFGTTPTEKMFENFSAIGFGEGADSSDSSGILRKAELSKKSALSDFIFEIDTTTKRGACTGDSGSPALGLTESGEVQPIGIAVASIYDEKTKKCQPSGYYINLDKHRDWILDTISEARGGTLPAATRVAATSSAAALK